MAVVARSVSSLLLARAAAMRRFPSESEQALWRLLGSRKLGARFVRQAVVVGRFIADFLAPRQRLIVEVNGGWHTGRRRADARRDEKLRRLGYRVVRLEAELVLRQPEQAAARVRVALASP